MKIRFLMIALLIVTLPALGENTPTTYPLESILQDMGGASLSQVRQTALNQTESQPNYKSVCVEDGIVFEGDVTNTTAKVLAVFSDDGVEVTVDGAVVHDRYRVGQHLPNLGASFHVLPIILCPVDANTLAHHIKVRYSNIIYRGLRDIDGCTLFAFDSPVQLDLNNMSLTVADGNTGLVHVMSASEKFVEGAELRVNANFDEAPTEHIEDYLHTGIKTDTPEDPDLLVGKLRLNAGTGTGKWRLTITQPSLAAVKVYWKDDAGTWAEVPVGWSTSEVTPPNDIELRLEGVGGSVKTKDVTIKADFQPSGSADVYSDSACVTVVKTEFMLSFDDGPFRENNQTKKILDALLNAFINGQHVHAAVFHVGVGCDSSACLHLTFDAKEGIDGYDGGDNYPLTKRAFDEGHHVGNHTASHPSTATYNEIHECELKIRAAIVAANQPELIFRPPYLHDIPTGVLPAGYNVIWGFLTGDGGAFPWLWQSWDTTADKVIARLKTWRTKAKPHLKKKPLLVIMHDYPEPDYNHLHDIINKIRNKGFLLKDFDSGECWGTDQLHYPNDGSGYYENNNEDP